MASERRILAVNVLFLSLAARVATYQCCVFSLFFLLMQGSQLFWFEFVALANVTRTRPWVGRLPHLEKFTCQNATWLTEIPYLADWATRLGRLPHLSCFKFCLTDAQP